MPIRKWYHAVYAAFSDLSKSIGVHASLHLWISINPAALDYMVFCHKSASTAHHVILDHLKVKALIDLQMRLGEGSGAAVAFPIIQSAVNFMGEMASFENAGVSQSVK